MGVYDVYTQANQSGLNNLINSRQNVVASPRIAAFMAGINAARQRNMEQQKLDVAQQREDNLTQYRLQGLSNKESNDFSTQLVNLGKLMGTASDPQGLAETAAQEAESKGYPDRASLIRAMGKSMTERTPTTDSTVPIPRMGVVAGQKQQEIENKAPVLAAQARNLGAQADYTIGPKTGLTNAQTGLAEANTATANAALPGVQAKSDLMGKLIQSQITRNERPPASYMLGGTGGFLGGFTPEAKQNFIEDVKRDPSLLSLVPARDMAARREVLSSVYGDGSTPNLAGAKAEQRANSLAYANTQKMISTLEPFEKTTLKNMDEFVKAAQRIADTGSPVFNAPLRTWNDKVLGSKDQAIFNAWLNVHRPEVARVIQTAQATGIVTQHSQDEINKILTGDATLPQIIAVTKDLQRAVSYRITELKRERDNLKRSTSSAAPSNQAPSNKQNYEGEVSSSGKYVFKNGQWVAR